MTEPTPIWTPSADIVSNANVTRFIRETIRPLGDAAADVADSKALYAWSIAQPREFWRSVWEFTGIIGERGDEVLVGGDRMAPPDPVLGPRWFPGARLNYAENLLRRRDDAEALVLWTEQGRARSLTFAQLSQDVASFAGYLRRAGVEQGDRVAAFVPNIPEVVVAMLATASIGAVWSSCSPDFGAQGVLDRFGQIEPKILVIADGYRYSGKKIDVIARTAAFLPSLPGVERVVVISNGASGEVAPIGALANAERWHEVLGANRDAAPGFARLPFDHPLYVMYSSGTTGLPKCMVHGAGGTLIQHLKELVLHTDLRADDRIFYFTTCGWMMWNWVVSSLAVGSTLVLYDGAPLIRGRQILWDLVARERVNVFGTSAKWLALTEKDDAHPATTHDLRALRTILSTGSPLAEHSYDFVHDEVKRDVQLSSISGGTDIISCFALGDPTLPVYRGELQTRGFGMRVDVWDNIGSPAVDEPGELVCTAPFPSMPVSFWNDPDGSKYRAAYFDMFPGVWRHGDWATLTTRGGLVIHGRSDATLNPGGVRIGTAEIYRQVDRLDGIMESIVIAQEFVDKRGADVRIVLFVKLRDGLVLDDTLRDRIRTRIRTNTTPHHVPKKIIQVADIPRTVSGKITELAVSDVVHGRSVKNIEALANPAALDHFRDLPELRTT